MIADESYEEMKTLLNSTEHIRNQTDATAALVRNLVSKILPFAAECEVFITHLEHLVVTTLGTHFKSFVVPLLRISIVLYLKEYSQGRI